MYAWEDRRFVQKKQRKAIIGAYIYFCNMLAHNVRYCAGL